MPCAKGKDTYPDLQTALIARDELIRVYAVPMLAYKCLGGCMKWHLTTQRKSGRKVREWNNIVTDEEVRKYWDTLFAAGYQPKTIQTVQPSKDYL